MKLQHRVENADHLGALQDLRDLALPAHQFRCLLGGTDCSRGVHLDAVEMHSGITLHEIDGPLRLDPRS